MTTYKELISTIKAELKAGIETCRWEKKDNQLYRLMTKDPEKYKAAFDAHRALPFNGTHFNSASWRAKHIAYCLFRGRTIDQIERPNSEGQREALYRANILLTQWKAECAEDIAAWEAKQAARKEAAEFQLGMKEQILRDMTQEAKASNG